MKLSRIAGLLAGVGILAGAQVALAATPNVIKFEGEITGSTCDIDSTLSSQTPIQMPKISTTEFSGLGSMAGWTGFVIKLKDCNPASGKVQAFFNADSYVDIGTGRLKNNAVSNAAPVQVQLRDIDASTSLVAGSLSTQFVDINPDGTATLAYSAGYYATVAAVTPGLVDASVTYTIAYQ